MRIGIDLGGTKTEAIVMNRAGEIVLRQRRPTPVDEGYDAILENIVDLVTGLEKEINQTVNVGLGTPGAISTRSGCLKNSNTTCLNGKPVKDDLERRLAREIRIANDANCFALSEAIDGAGRQHRTVFGVIIGTGVGGGIVIDNKLHEGPQNIAGEWGHNILEADGPPCYCGRRGCVETLLSGPGMVRDYQGLGGHRDRDAPAIVGLSEKGDNLAQQTLRRYFDRFGRALSVVVNILDPDIIVLGGGMSNIHRLYTEGREKLANYVFNDELLTPLVRHVHGDSAGVRGAAWLWPAT